MTTFIVELLFSLMADEIAFQKSLRKAISEKIASCIRSSSDEKDWPLKSGIVISE